MKLYTDIEQSKKLAEILPIESADGHYWKNGWNKYNLSIGHSKELQEGYEAKKMVYIPCWSLSALLGVIPEVSLNTFKNGKWNAMVLHNGKMIYGDKDNPVDACYEMILKLHELKAL